MRWQNFASTGDEKWSTLLPLERRGKRNRSLASRSLKCSCFAVVIFTVLFFSTPLLPHFELRRLRRLWVPNFSTFPTDFELDVKVILPPWIKPNVESIFHWIGFTGRVRRTDCTQTSPKCVIQWYFISESVLNPRGNAQTGGTCNHCVSWGVAASHPSRHALHRMQCICVHRQSSFRLLQQYETGN